MIPFIGTSLGAAAVFFLKNNLNKNVEKGLLGFASGVMIAASVWSLIIPGMEMSSQQGKIEWLPAAIGFMAGLLFLLLLDSLVPHMHLNDDHPEGMNSQLKKTTMLVLAVTMHNIPEGMAVGIIFAGMFAENAVVSISAAFSLAIGIAIQNFPEGAVISMPLKGCGISKSKAFSYGVLSGIVEPAAALITILLSSYIMPILPYLMSFAAGAMFYVVVEELIPEAQSGEHTNITTICAALGFTVMMILDSALG